MGISRQGTAAYWFVALAFAVAACSSEAVEGGSECDGAEGVTCVGAEDLDSSEIGTPLGSGVRRARREYTAGAGDEPARRFESGVAALEWDAIPHRNAAIESVSVRGVIQYPFATAVGIWLATQDGQGTPVVRELRDATYYGAARTNRYAFQYTTRRFNGLPPTNAWTLRVAGPRDVYLIDCWTATSSATESFGALSARGDVFSSDLTAYGYERSASWQERHCDEYARPLFLSDVHLVVTYREYPSVEVAAAAIPPLAAGVRSEQSVVFDVPAADYGAGAVVRAEFQTGGAGWGCEYRLCSHVNGQLFVNLVSPRSSWRRVFSNGERGDPLSMYWTTNSFEVLTLIGLFDGRPAVGEEGPARRWEMFAPAEIPGQWRLVFQWLNATAPLQIDRARLMVNPPRPDSRRTRSRSGALAGRAGSLSDHAAVNARSSA